MKIHEVTMSESASFGCYEYLSDDFESKYLGLYANINDAQRGVVEVAKELVRINSQYDLRLKVEIKSEGIVVTTCEGGNYYVLDDRFKREYMDYQHLKEYGCFPALMYWQLHSQAEIFVDDIEVRESLNS